MSDSVDDININSQNKTELQGINQLVIDAVKGVVSTVESLHKRISHVAGITGSPSNERTSGITGAVYQGVRSIVDIIGNAIDIPLGVLSKSNTKNPKSKANKALRAALNGILGDFLHSQKNPLAITMHFSYQGEPLNQQDLVSIVRQAVEETEGKLLLMVHGLCMNDAQWCSNGHDHGARLASEHGFTPLYLNYNSGQHISTNGQHLAELLEIMSTQSRGELQLYVVSHSMGGLVTRSAHYYAQNNQQSWPMHLKKVVFLGTPHHGAPLEKAGHWLELLLDAHPYTTPFARLVSVRSKGITDLRQGNISEFDWKPRGPFNFNKDKRKPVPLPNEPEFYAIAGSIGDAAKHRNVPGVGDGLVTVDSAFGKHESKDYTLQFKFDHKCQVAGINHMQLLSSPVVYDKIQSWIV